MPRTMVSEKRVENAWSKYNRDSLARISYYERK